MNTKEWICAATWAQRQNLPVFPLLQTETVPQAETVCALETLQAGVLTGSSAVLRACAPLDARRCFLRAAADDLPARYGRCRYTAEGPDDIRRLDALAAPRLKQGYLEEIALRIWPWGGGGFTAQTLPDTARLMRKAAHLAVRGLFLVLDPGEDLSRQARDAFSLVKTIRSDFPCMLHAFCLEGVLMPLAAGDGALLETLRMLASLNETSLYATFFIS